MKRAMALADLLPDVDVPRGIVVRGLVLDSRAVEPGLNAANPGGTSYSVHPSFFAPAARPSGTMRDRYPPTCGPSAPGTSSAFTTSG